DAGDADAPARRRRGRRGGRGRRGRGAGDGAGEQADGTASGTDDDGPEHKPPAADANGAAAPTGGRRDADGDDGGNDADRGGRGGQRGGRSRGGRGGGQGGNRTSDDRPNDTRPSNGRPAGDRPERPERRERSTEPIVGVSDEDAIAIPGTPEELPYAPIDDPADDLDLAGATLRDLLTLLGYLDTEITAREPETPGDGTGLIEHIFDIYGTNDDASDELGVLIGRRGETLAALQYVINTIVAKGGNKSPAFGIDIEGYRRRREEMLVDLAREIAQEVRETGDVITLEPMPANERRIVHIVLRDEDGVRTESVGSGDQRQVEVLPE
ncbi:MAG: KH domain-containing protein, partial [Chloroflexi bacterium]|nr:KH domain-containing protein [Chloroflexota bacterium]